MSVALDSLEAKELKSLAFLHCGAATGALDAIPEYSAMLSRVARRHVEHGVSVPELSRHTGMRAHDLIEVICSPDLASEARRVAMEDRAYMEGL